VIGVGGLCKSRLGGAYRLVVFVGGMRAEGFRRSRAGARRGC
jgi:hypothetical protein